jgi:hypothetical protein
MVEVEIQRRKNAKTSIERANEAVRGFVCRQEDRTNAYLGTKRAAQECKLLRPGYRIRGARKVLG